MLFCWYPYALSRHPVAALPFLLAASNKTPDEKSDLSAWRKTNIQRNKKAPWHQPRGTL
ncbi:hypothetical protein HPTD01_1098 [Halomonas sp. TD01]|nr:hypothetical protein HPTD01_1098 [Halomonas sp. TD01]